MGNAIEGTPGVRRAVHADGKWYHANEDALTEQIQALLNDARPAVRRNHVDKVTVASPPVQQQQQNSPLSTPYDEKDNGIQPNDVVDDHDDNNSESILCDHHPIRALIVPHGPLQIKSAKTAAAAYRRCNPLTLQHVQSILLLYPSHNPSVAACYKGQCAITGADGLATPAATLRVDPQLREELFRAAPDAFVVLSQDHDEQEHGAELQFPWIAHVLRTCNRLETVTVTPVMVGSLTTTGEIALAGKLRSIIQRRDILVIVSTNLCYWGSTVRYQSGDRRMSVPEYLAMQDRRLLHLLVAQDVAGLASFWLQTDHTTCGRHALALWLRCMNQNDNIKITLCEYQQSSDSIETSQDSCVTYGSLVATETPPG